MIHDHGTSLSEQHTTDLLLCHGTQQDLSLSNVTYMTTIKAQLDNVAAKSSPVIGRYHIRQQISQASAATVATYALS